MTTTTNYGLTLFEESDAFRIHHDTQSVNKNFQMLDAGAAKKMDTVLETTLSRGRKANTTVGERSVAYGDNVEASGKDSNAFGKDTKASAGYSCARGNGSTASGNYSTAEGYYTKATASCAHAEGSGTEASGDNSHAEGSQTKANHRSQHVSGEYNVPDPSGNSFTSRGNYAEIVGNGSNNNSRSNARALDWSGNERLKGNVYVECENDSSGGKLLATAKYVEDLLFAGCEMYTYSASSPTTFQPGTYYHEYERGPYIWKLKGSNTRTAAGHLPTSSDSYWDVYKISLLDFLTAEQA